jgi:O-antigen/teichoic acid export membrane protein
MTPYLTRKFGGDTSKYGIFSDLYAWATIIIALMIFRMDTAYFRFSSKNEKSEDEVYSATFILMSVMSAIVILLMIIFKENIASFLGYTGQAYYVQWFALILAFDAFTTLIYARFRLQRRPFRFMFFRFANVLLTIILTLGFLDILPQYFPDTKILVDKMTGINSDLDYVFYANLLASMIVFFMMIPEFLKFKFIFNWGFTKEILAYSWPLVIIILAGSINQYASVPIQNFLLEGDAVSRKAQSGIFGGCAKIAILLNLVTTAFNYAAEPFFFNQAKNGDKNSMNGVVAKAFTIFSCIVILMTYFYLDLALLLIAKSYRSGEDIVPILLMSYLFLGLYYSVSIWYKLADKTIYGAIIAAATALVTIVLSIILIPTIGIIGSAWASLGCFVFEAGMGYYLGQKYYPIEYPVKDILTYIGITSLFLIIAWFIRKNIDTITIRYVINTIMLIGFFGYIYVFEKSFFAKHLLKN